ncbi:DNA alkylation repair enzyme [Bathymodiolus brooksi thiotrophic gill symbiont]|nr:DNA alkylation repair enzyme [Bathymodiolus brooksi thiotrophic gill symbiont]
MTEKFSLRDELFNPKKVTYLAALIKSVYADFKDTEFTQKIIVQFPKLALKQRIICIRQHLEIYLPKDYPSALKIIISALPCELDPTKIDQDFGDFIFAPLSDFVAKNGLQNQSINLSFNALAEITKRFSCEDAIRYFINHCPEKSFVFMQTMAHSDNYHQRRLASEGFRPKLPWCIGINFDYKKALSILDDLYFDNTRYVVRSVANHLNDIAKIDPELVIHTLTRWQMEGKQSNPKELDFLIKHTLRTLVKKGNIQALDLLGFNANPDIKITAFHIENKQINLGEYLNFSFKVSSVKEMKLMLDYKIIYSNPNARHCEKVFKIKQLSLKSNTPVLIEKKHLFKYMSTKKLYSGNHQIQLQINGRLYDKGDFTLIF